MDPRAAHPGPVEPGAAHPGPVDPGAARPGPWPPEQPTLAPYGSVCDPSRVEKQTFIGLPSMEEEGPVNYF